MGCQADMCVERILQSTVATGKSASTKTEDIEYHHPWLNRRRKDDRTDWWAEVSANLFPLVPGCLFWLLRLPGSRRPSLCCSESADSIDIELNSENSEQLRLCFLFFSHSHFSMRFDVLHTVILLCASANLANSASLTCSNRLFFVELWPTDFFECHCHCHRHCRWWSYRVNVRLTTSEAVLVNTLFLCILCGNCLRVVGMPWLCRILKSLDRCQVLVLSMCSRTQIQGVVDTNENYNRVVIWGGKELSSTLCLHKCEERNCCQVQRKDDTRSHLYPELMFRFVFARPSFLKWETDGEPSSFFCSQWSTSQNGVACGVNECSRKWERGGNPPEHGRVPHHLPEGLRVVPCPEEQDHTRRTAAKKIQNETEVLSRSGAGETNNVWGGGGRRSSGKTASGFVAPAETTMWSESEVVANSEAANKHESGRTILRNWVEGLWHSVQESYNEGMDSCVMIFGAHRLSVWSTEFLSPKAPKRLGDETRITSTSSVSDKRNFRRQGDGGLTWLATACLRIWSCCTSRWFPRTGRWMRRRSSVYKRPEVREHDG